MSYDEAARNSAGLLTPYGPFFATYNTPMPGKPLLSGGLAVVCSHDPAKYPLLGCYMYVRIIVGPKIMMKKCVSIFSAVIAVALVSSCQKQERVSAEHAHGNREQALLDERVALMEHIATLDNRIHDLQKENEELKTKLGLNGSAQQPIAPLPKESAETADPFGE